MIRSIYTELDTQLKDFQEKFQRDEAELRSRIDMEIKQQMSKRLENLNLSQTPNYGKEFLDIIGKNTAYGKINYLDYSDNTKFTNYFIEQNRNVICDKNKSHIYTSFFYNLQELNTVSQLKHDEYIIGIYGYISLNFQTYNNSCSSSTYNCSICIKHLCVITNYLNIYAVINQFDYSQQNSNKNIKDRYSLKSIKKNDMLLYDEQIDLISSLFHKLLIEINYSCQNTNIKSYSYTIYDKDERDLINFQEAQIEYSDKINKTNFNVLRKDCLTEVNDISDDMLKCCQKCFNKYNNHKHTNFKTSITKLKSKISKKNSDRETKLREYRRQFGTIDLPDFSVEETMLTHLETQFNDFWADKISPITDLTPQIKSLEDEIEDLKSSKLSLEDKIKILNKEKRGRSSKIKILESQNQVKDNELIEIQDKTMTQQKEIDTLQKENESLTIKLTNFEKEYETYKFLHQRTKEESMVVQGNLEKTESKNKELLSNIQDKNHLVDELLKQLELMESAHNKTKDTIVSLTDKLSVKENKISMLELRVKDLRYQKEKLYEGNTFYNNSILFLLAVLFLSFFVNIL